MLSRSHRLRPMGYAPHSAICTDGPSTNDRYTVPSICTFHPCSLRTLPSFVPGPPNGRTRTVFVIHIVDVTNNTTSNFQLTIDALADYAKETGIDLPKNPFAARSSNQIVLRIFFNYSRSGRRLFKNIATEIADW